jgi:hypothetical protein
MESIKEKTVSFENIKQKDGKCLICGKDAEKQNTYINNKTNEKIHCYWDICEKCKKIKNCFTCAYSKCWYLRYKGRCDVSFEYFVISTFFLEEKEVTDEDKKMLQTLLAKYEIEVKDRSIKITEFIKLIDKDERISKEDNLLFHNLFDKYNLLLNAVKKKDKKSFNKVLKRYNLEDIDLNTSVFEFLDIIKEKNRSIIEDSLPDCRLYKTKKIGVVIGDYWNHIICKRYRKGDASKEEYDDYNGDFDWSDQDYDNWSYSDDYGDCEYDY